MSCTIDQLEALVKALEAGGYNASPDPHLHQGSGPDPENPCHDPRCSYYGGPAPEPLPVDVDDRRTSHCERSTFNDWITTFPWGG